MAAAMAALAEQKTAMMMSMWDRNRHSCENYSPYSPTSLLPAGTDGTRVKLNTECTGWEFYHWGALNGLLAILEVIS